MALSTAHAIFTSKMHTSGLFSACAQQGSMLTLASLSRVPISTDTLGTAMCCFFNPLQGLSAECSPCTTLKRAHSSFFPLFSLLFYGIPEFQFRENSRSQNLRVFGINDHLIRLIRSLDSSIAKIKIPSITNIKNSIDREH